jgi:hypothetical protein
MGSNRGSIVSKLVTGISTGLRTALGSEPAETRLRKAAVIHKFAVAVLHSAVRTATLLRRPES